MLVNIMQDILVHTGEELHQIILDTGAVIQGISLFCMPFFVCDQNACNTCLQIHLNNNSIFTLFTK